MIVCVRCAPVRRRRVTIGDGSGPDLSDATPPTSAPPPQAPAPTPPAHHVHDLPTPGDIGAATASHSYAASAITSGTIDIARIPTGTTPTTVPLGNDARFSDARTPTAQDLAPVRRQRRADPRTVTGNEPHDRPRGEGPEVTR